MIFNPVQITQIQDKFNTLNVNLNDSCTTLVLTRRLYFTEHQFSFYFWTYLLIILCLSGILYNENAGYVALLKGALIFTPIHLLLLYHLLQTWFNKLSFKIDEEATVQKSWFNSFIKSYTQKTLYESLTDSPQVIITHYDKNRPRSSSSLAKNHYVEIQLRLGNGRIILLYKQEVDDYNHRKEIRDALFLVFYDFNKMLIDETRTKRLNALKRYVPSP